MLILSAASRGRPRTAASPASTFVRMQWAAVAFVAVTTLLVVGYLVDDAVADRRAWFVVSRLLSTAVFTVGVRTARRGFRRDWRLMLAAMYVWVCSDLTAAADLQSSGMPASWQLSVVLSLVAFGLMTLGVVRLAGRDGFVRGASVGLDSAVYVIATLLGWWLLVGHSLVERRTALTPATFASGIIPVADGLLLVAASALMSSRAAHALSSRALVVFCLTGLAGDLGFARLTLGENVGMDVFIPAVWMVQFAAAGVAALLSGRSAAREQSRLSLVTVVLLVGAVVGPALTSACVTAAHAGMGHRHEDALPAIVVGTVAMAVLVALRARLLVAQIERQADELERTARTDELTQLPNRRAGDRLLDEAVAKVSGIGDSTLSVAILDLDHFKSYNDTYGHQQGDRLLRGAGLAWSSVLAGRGSLFRYGGEEFVVVLPDTCAQEAERIVGALRLATPDGQTFSAGLATLRPGDDAHALVGRADASLYAAKDAGRARTMVSA